jgi:periplasmic protein TonB
VTALRLPLAASVAGHSAGLAALVLLAAQLQPLPLPEPKAVEVELAVLAPPLVPEPFPVMAEPQPPEPEPPPVAKEEPPPPSLEPEPPPPAVTAEPPPPPPPPKRVVQPKPPPPRPPPRVVREAPREPPEPLYRPPVMPMPMPQPAPTQMAAVPMPHPAPAPPPAPTGPVVSAGYRAMLSAWLESHKRYPESARSRGEEGRAVLRFRVDRSGRLLNFAIAQSTGFPDLDAAINEMMRGANLPSFPADMTASDVDVSVTIRFGLTR